MWMVNFTVAILKAKTKNIYKYTLFLWIWTNKTFIAGSKPVLYRDVPHALMWIQPNKSKPKCIMTAFDVNDKKQ